MGKFIDMTGTKIGNLEVLGMAPGRDKNGNILWTCKCNICGSVRNYYRENLLRKGRADCGCVKKAAKEKVKPGMRFGRWTVIEKSKDRVGKKQCIGWLCRCDCGNQKIVSSPVLLSGESNSCGCLNDEVRKKMLQERWDTVWANKKSKNTYVYKGEYVEVSDKNGKTFIIDCADLELIKDKYWYVMNTNYVCTYSGILLHRYLLSAKDGYVVDHINHNTLDNRRKNLRLCTYSQNLQNKRPFDIELGCKGIYKNKEKWAAAIGINNKHIYLGSYDHIEDAIKARRAAEEKYFGEFNYDKQQDYKTIDKDDVSFD